jgi:hypothetical protein
MQKHQLVDTRRESGELLGEFVLLTAFLDHLRQLGVQADIGQMHLMGQTATTHVIEKRSKEKKKNRIGKSFHKSCREHDIYNNSYTNQER